MTKHNGQEQVEPSNSHGYAIISVRLVNAACNHFFDRRGMPRCESGRFGFLPIACSKNYCDDRPRGRVVRVKRSALSRNRKTGQ